jgi:hypothetical protein
MTSFSKNRQNEFFLFVFFCLFETTVINQNFVCLEIRNVLNSGNACYYVFQNLCLPACYIEPILLGELRYEEMNNLYYSQNSVY